MHLNVVHSCSRLSLTGRLFSRFQQSSIFRGKSEKKYGRLSFKNVSSVIMQLISALMFNVQLPFSDLLQPSRDEKARASLVDIDAKHIIICLTCRFTRAICAKSSRAIPCRTTMRNRDRLTVKLDPAPIPVCLYMCLLHFLASLHYPSFPVSPLPLYVSL